MKVLGLIPARGGSKRIPGKNLKSLGGRPLISYSIIEALKSKIFSDVVVSTDDLDIAEYARQQGAQVPFIRPRGLSDDSSSGIDVVFHALSQLPNFDWVMLLQPTSPFRQYRQIVEAMNLVLDLQVDSLVSVRKLQGDMTWFYLLDPNNFVRPLVSVDGGQASQILRSPLHCLNGAIYLARVDYLFANQSFLSPSTLGFVMDERSSIDLDTPDQWSIAEDILLGRSRG